MHRTLRVGTPPYLVARPLNLGLERESGFRVVPAVPARLVDGLRRGELDLALVSSIELFRHPGYGYLDGIAVLGRGAVSSVQVFLRRPLDDLRSVVLDPASRAAQTLVRVVLAQRLGRDAVRFHEPAEGTDPKTEAERLDAGGWLEIGDAALRRALSPGAPRTFDPAHAWVADTGLPFAFAVWIVRPGLELEAREVRAFHEARDRGAAAIEELARHASREWQLAESACLKYLREECGFAAGPELARSLTLLRDRASELGLCRRDLELRAIPFPHVSPAR